MTEEGIGTETDYTKNKKYCSSRDFNSAGHRASLELFIV